MLLVGDIGGTKTDLAIYSRKSDANSPLTRKQFNSADYVSLQAMVTEFLADVKLPVNHAIFAPTETRQIRLLEHMLARADHVSVERVCSGIGIPYIYEYLREVEHVYEAPEIARRIASAEDRTKVIINSAVDPHNESPLCRATIEMFVSTLPGEAGNRALQYSR